MSVFGNLFGGSGGVAHNGNGNSTPIPAAPAPAPVAAPAPANSATGTTAPAPPPGGTPESGSSLDQFQSFWDTRKNADGTPVAAPVDPTNESIFNLDPKLVQESSRKLDFTTGLDPELVTKALSGDAQAFIQTINHATQQAIAAATLNTGRMINESHATNNSRLKSTLPTQIKQVQLSQVESSNPVFQHPAAAPLVSALKAMAFQKDPSANPADVQRQVEALLIGLGTAIADETPERKATVAAAKAGEQDWSAFLA